MDKVARMKVIIPLLDNAARAYYQENREIMSNLEYDSLYDELISLEKETGIVMAGSPTGKVGYEILGDLPKERHAQPRLSLDKTKEIDALKAWLGGKEGILSWKLDGLTVILTYEGGRLEKAVTRGNGEVGEVITSNARTFVNVPLTIPFQDRLEVRGEAVIFYSDFERLNAGIEDVDARYKNPRNLCSGSVRQLNTEITAQRNVHFIAFSLLSAETADFGNARTNEFTWLEEQGFSVVEHTPAVADNIAEMVADFESRVKTYDIPSDGLVLQYNDIAYGLGLGNTSKYPRHSIAFKWQDETAETVLREVEWSASRTGLINPVAIFDPVELEGTTVGRASVHNISILESMKLGIGDHIVVYKANMIIPQISENLSGSGPLDIPDLCPVCGGKTEIKQDNDVKSLYCVNDGCLAKKIKLFGHFVSRDALNIEGLSEATIEKLIAKGMIKELADIFRVSEFKEEIVEMEGFGEKSYTNLTANVEKARNTTPVRFLYSLGIPNIGLSTAKLICRHYKQDINLVIKAEQGELTEIDGVGPVIAELFAAYFQKEENLKNVDDVLEVLNLQAEEMESATKELEGLTFVITGTVTEFGNRNALKSLIEGKGGKVTGTVTGNTDYLINNDNMSASAKNKKAAQLEVPVITEAEFKERFIVLQ